MPSASKSPRQRIVSLAPNVTSILLAIGAGRELVGVSKWCKDVAAVGNRPQVGDCWKLDIAEVMRLRPTLLIGSVPFATGTVEHILKQPVAFLALNPRTLADVAGDIRMLGRFLDRRRAAETLIARMAGAFQQVAKRAALRSRNGRVRVYCEAWPNPRISSPRWVAELVEMAGGKMAVPAGERVSDLDVAEANPEVIVLAWTATRDGAKPDSALANPAWQHVRAVKNRRVVVIRDELLNTPGPPLVEGVRLLAKALNEK
jgi:iron complex transport system substrate-binding protein